MKGRAHAGPISKNVFPPPPKPPNLPRIHAMPCHARRKITSFRTPRSRTGEGARGQTRAEASENPRETLTRRDPGREKWKDKKSQNESNSKAKIHPAPIHFVHANPLHPNEKPPTQISKTMVQEGEGTKKNEEAPRYNFPGGEPRARQPGSFFFYEDQGDGDPRASLATDRSLCAEERGKKKSASQRALSRTQKKHQTGYPPSPMPIPSQRTKEISRLADATPNVKLERK